MKEETIDKIIETVAMVLMMLVWMGIISIGLDYFEDLTISITSVLMTFALFTIFDLSYKNKELFESNESMSKELNEIHQDMSDDAVIENEGVPL